MTQWEQLEPHPIAALFPGMTDEQFAGLRDDIKTRGLMDPITLYEGKILDGIHRHRACKDLRIRPEIQTYGGPEALAVELVVSRNLHRRHLTDAQRAMIAAELAQRARGKPKKVNPPNGGLTERKLSEEQAVKLMKVPKRTVERAKRVRREGAPETVQAVKDGKTTLAAAEQTITRAARAKAPKTTTKPDRFTGVGSSLAGALNNAIDKMVAASAASPPAAIAPAAAMKPDSTGGASDLTCALSELMATAKTLPPDAEVKVWLAMISHVAEFMQVFTPQLCREFISSGAEREQLRKDLLVLQDWATRARRRFKKPMP